jgi:hypothetical protein
MVRELFQITGPESITSVSPESFGATARIDAVKKVAKRGVGLGVFAGVVYAVWRAYQKRMPAPRAEGSWEAAPFPFPPIPRPSPGTASTPRSDLPAARSNGSAPPSIEPSDGECPDSHPVKGKLASGIYHVPGGLNYDRTRPDRCYTDATSAESDGLRPSKI